MKWRERAKSGTSFERAIRRRRRIILFGETVPSALDLVLGDRQSACHSIPAKTPTHPTQPERPPHGRVPPQRPPAEHQIRREWFPGRERGEQNEARGTEVVEELQRYDLC